MHGLLVTTWEKFLLERFGHSLYHLYRAANGDAPAPLVNRIYGDDVFFNGVKTASQLTGTPAEILLRNYGHYFIVNSLTSHLCAYYLARVSNGRELLLIMREAHAQMSRTADAVNAPIFEYEINSHHNNEITLIYSSPRKLCKLVWGAIEGAADRYGDRVQVAETVCMHQGASICRLEARFQRARQPIRESSPLDDRHHIQQQIMDLIIQILPDTQGLTFNELQQQLQVFKTPTQYLRPSLLLGVINHLQHAGLVASKLDLPGDDLTHRRYWRVPIR